MIEVTKRKKERRGWCSVVQKERERQKVMWALGHMMHFSWSHSLKFLKWPLF